MERMLTKKATAAGCTMEVTVMKLGEDFQICLAGGEKPDRNDEEKTKDRNLTEVFQDHLPCSDADKCRVSDLPHGISSNGEQKADGRAEREFPGAGSSGSLRL